MAKQCPLIMIGFHISNRSRQESSLDCDESYCQMWDEKRNDCGLKHPSPTQKQNKIPEDGNVETSCPVTIPEKDWDEQMDNQPDFHPVDCPNPLPSEPE